MRRKILNIMWLIVLLVIFWEFLDWRSSRESYTINRIEAIEYELPLFFGNDVVVTVKNDVLTIRYKNNISDAYDAIAIINEYPYIVDVRKVIIKYMELE